MKRTYQVYCIVGGSSEQVVLFENESYDKCIEVYKSYVKNPRKASAVTRNYLQGWGNGIDDFGIVEKA